MTEDEMVGWHPHSMDMSLSKLRETVMDREAWGLPRVGYDLATEQRHSNHIAVSLFTQNKQTERPVQAFPIQ